MTSTMTHRPPSGHARESADESAHETDHEKSHYVELVRTGERMTAAVRTLEGISSVLARTRDDPRELLRQVVLAAAEHLQSDWTMIALRRDAVCEPGEHFFAVGPSGRMIDSVHELPATLREELYRAGEPPARDAGVGGGWVRVPLELDGEILGRLVGLAPVGPFEHADLWVLQILANQAAVSVHTATLYGTASDLRERAQQLHRIALELHDGVTQYVVSAGLAADVRRAEAAVTAPEAAQRLIEARDRIDKAGEQVRSVICALDHETSIDDAVMLPDRVRALTAREFEVLRLLARGMSNRAIGTALFISETTAKFHVANIMRKLEVTRRAEAVYVASKTGAV